MHASQAYSNFRYISIRHKMLHSLVVPPCTVQHTTIVPSYALFKHIYSPSGHTLFDEWVQWVYPSLLLLSLIPQRFERGWFLSIYDASSDCATYRLRGSGGLRKVQFETVMGTRGGRRGLRGGGLLRVQHEICGFCVCGVHFVLAAHVVALNCGKLSTQQAGQDGRMWHVAWWLERLRGFYVYLWNCALQSFRTVHANLCLILAIKPLRAHTLRRIESRAARIH